MPRSSSGALGVEGLDSGPRRVGSGNFRYQGSQGEDKVEEKARRRSPDGEKRPIGSARYAKLIPEQQPPQLPVSVKVVHNKFLLKD